MKCANCSKKQLTEAEIKQGRAVAKWTFILIAAFMLLMIVGECWIQ